MLEATGIDYCIDGATLVKDFRIRIRKGTFHVIIGPNGAGKSSALRMLCGELKPTAGEVLLWGKPIAEMRAQRLAKERACFEQSSASTLPFTVREVISLGRLPHMTGPYESDADKAVVSSTLTRMELNAMSERSMTTLSGGEATRTHLGRVSAQATQFYLLDEPTNHLDVRHQLDTLAYFHGATRAGAAVVAVLHDLNLASFFADEITVMQRGETVAQGSPEAVMTRDMVRDVYHIDSAITMHPSGKPWVVPIPGHLPELGSNTFVAFKNNPTQGDKNDEHGTRSHVAFG